MKVLRKLSVLLLVIVCLFSVACGGGSTPKAVNAEAKYETVLAQVMEMLNEEVYVKETETLKITKAKYVEITNDDMVASIIGNVYYELTYAVVEDGLFHETGFAYAYYDAGEDAVYGVGIKEFYSKSYNDYYSYVKSGSTEGVIGEIQIAE